MPLPLYSGNTATPYPMVPVRFRYLAAPQSPTIRFPTSATSSRFLGCLKKSVTYRMRSIRAFSFPPTCLTHQDHSGMYAWTIIFPILLRSCFLALLTITSSESEGRGCGLSKSQSNSTRRMPLVSAFILCGTLDEAGPQWLKHRVTPSVLAGTIDAAFLQQQPLALPQLRHLLSLW